MAWTYMPGLVATEPLYQVRRLLGDVISTDQQIADEEIAFALTLRGNIYGATAEAARMIAAQYARKVDVIVSSGAGGQMKTNWSAQMKSYLSLAAQMETRATIGGGALPYAGGISQSDKRDVETQGDRVQPQYNIGMTDNLDNPLGPVGNETPGSPASVASE